jgi:hypothetical protein
LYEKLYPSYRALYDNNRELMHDLAAMQDLASGS